ncbi:ABC-2 type transport system permease protein [Haloactinospora alba]|uniref:Transport permease protein n=1 Tax=Haloactinospora alba TaxID=405555 RepID=A0A543NHS3_9ACTN|nr:ABC transporter permease [Haloactinospora alba]TQN31392.1 ABC-2 type transport system permease protein [Haloactinospora alba]
MTNTQSHSATSMFVPAPGAAPLWRMVASQASMEVRIMLRNGEQILLTLVIPVLLLVGFSTTSVLGTGPGARVEFLTPGILALAVMSTAFTGQAIGTGFERRYGVLKRLGATPLPRFGLLAAKTLAILGIELIQIGVLCVTAFLLGWTPSGGITGLCYAAALVLLATAAFSSLALLLAGTLRAEATLAAANLVYVLLLGLGGVILPVHRFPASAQPLLELLPITALTEGLRAALGNGGTSFLTSLGVLGAWGLLGSLLASRFFRWE